MSTIIKDNILVDQKTGHRRRRHHVRNHCDHHDNHHPATAQMVISISQLGKQHSLNLYFIVLIFTNITSTSVKCGLLL